MWAVVWKELCWIVNCIALVIEIRIKLVSIAENNYQQDLFLYKIDVISISVRYIDTKFGTTILYRC